METCPSANPDHSPNKPKPCPEVGSEARSAHREPIVGAAPSRRMRASYPAKSQTLRPEVGPPTESKAQKPKAQRKPKRPSPAVTCFCLWEPRPRGERAPPAQQTTASPRDRASHRTRSPKAQRKPKPPPPAVTCFFVGGAPSRRMRAIARYPSQRTSRQGSPELKTYQPSCAHGRHERPLLSETEIETLLTNSPIDPTAHCRPERMTSLITSPPPICPKPQPDRPHDS